MLAPNFSQADFTAAFQKLLPRGLVWPRDPDAVQTEFWSAMAPTYVRNSVAAAGLLQESPAFNLNQLLPEWEATLGLPDPCAGESQSLAQRVAQVVARFANTGGQSIQYFLDLAESLGYVDVVITEYKPARAGHSRCGDPDCGEPWAFVWLVTAALSVSYARCGISRCGDPLYSINGADVLECNINRYKPAHTYVLFGDAA